jgi:signal transduction histidine kinase
MSGSTNITAAGTEPAIRPQELGELLSVFNDATARLQVAHESLHAEVARLKSELREANEQLERSRRLAALGEMAAGIAHEVRNPLGSIRLYARMLEQDLAGRPDERRLAEKIGGAVRGLDAVVCDVLSFAREMPVRSTRASAGALLRGAVDEALSDERLTGAGRAPAVRLEPIDPVCEGTMIECDEQLVHRALVNVIRNAIEAMLLPETGPRVREPALTLGVREAEGPGMVGLFVRDTGPGIPPEAMERIFNPFFTTRATGTGLGLAIVHRIVDAHGGRTRVRNLPPRNGGGGPGAAAGGAEVELVFPVLQQGGKRCADRSNVGPSVEVRAGLEAGLAGGAMVLQTRVTEDAA